jgi:predicted nucleic acid-binding Zn ribbon protein
VVAGALRRDTSYTTEETGGNQATQATASGRNRGSAAHKENPQIRHGVSMKCACGKPAHLRTRGGRTVAPACAGCRHTTRNGARRLKAVKHCPVCAIPFRPFSKDQKGCSRVCGAILKHRTHPEQKLTGLRAMNARRAQLRREKEQALINGCKTLVEAFRAGQKLERARWHLLKQLGRAELRQARYEAVMGKAS